MAISRTRYIIRRQASYLQCFDLLVSLPAELSSTSLTLSDESRLTRGLNITKMNLAPAHSPELESELEVSLEWLE